MEPDLILANSTPVTVALREQSGAVPIVFTQVVDPVGQGLVPNLAHPGGNLTGFTSFEFSIGTKWLEALKQTAPRVTRVALVFNPQSAPFADLFLRPMEAAAPSFSIMLIGAAVRDPADVDRVFAVRVLMHDRPACGPSDKRVLLSSSIPLPPSPPAEKATAR
jgi:putative tryptophan/tyrosine transport system substrate-binding protein